MTPSETSAPRHRPAPLGRAPQAAPLSPFARQAALRAESARLRQDLGQAAQDTWTDWRTHHAAEISAFSWGVRQGRRLMDGWHHLAQHPASLHWLAGPALALGWWIVRGRRSAPTRAESSARHDTPRDSLLSRSVDGVGALVLLSRLSRLVRWARWLRWGWTIGRRWARAASRPDQPQ